MILTRDILTARDLALAEEFADSGYRVVMTCEVNSQGWQVSYTVDLRPWHRRLYDKWIRGYEL